MPANSRWDLIQGFKGYCGGNREQDTTEDISSYELGNHTGWRKLRNVKHHNLYCPSNNIRGIKLKGMRWAGHIAGIEERSKAYIILCWKT